MYDEFAMEPPSDIAADGASAFLLLVQSQHNVSIRRDAGACVRILLVEFHGAPDSAEKWTGSPDSIVD